MEVVKLIFFALLALFILVTFHEFGHYWVARRCGVKVLRFSVGFGPIILSKKTKETEFALSAIPLGGYVKMFGEGTQGPDEEISEAEQAVSFSHKPVWQRMAIVSAGPIANFILAIAFYFMAFMGGTTGIAPLIGTTIEDSVARSAGIPDGAEILAIDGKSTNTWEDVFDRLVKRVGETGVIVVEWGQQDSSVSQTSDLPIQRWHSDTDAPDLLGSLGIEIYRPQIEAVVSEVMPDTPAEAAGIQAEDRILRTDGIDIDDWNQWVDIVRAAPDQDLQIVLDRGGDTISTIVTPERRVENGETFGSVGIAVVMPVWDESVIRKQSYNPVSALTAASLKTWEMSGFILGSLKKLIVGEVSTKSIGGPVSIAKFAGASAEAGWQQFFKFIAVLSVMLAVMNLLPIPVLDGGHLLFYIVEAIKGSPLSETIQGVAMRLGMTAVFGIMLLALYNDFTRL